MLVSHSLTLRFRVSKLDSFEARVLFQFCLTTQRSLSLSNLSGKIVGPLVTRYKLINNNNFKDRSFQWYLVLDILTNPVRVTLTKKVTFWGISLFSNYSLKTKFASFLKSWPATIPCKRRTIKWATKLLIIKKGKGKKRAREKDRTRFA